ncbi:hypothetical protein OSTOST_21147, partial [Ostertagia ostertagi]
MVLGALRDRSTTWRKKRFLLPDATVGSAELLPFVALRKQCLCSQSPFEELRELSKNCRTPIDAFLMDVSSDQSVTEAEKIPRVPDCQIRRRGRISDHSLHGLVNNAGILGKEFFDDFLTVDDYKAVAEVNAWGVIRVTQANEAPSEKSEIFNPDSCRGRIVTITSICSRIGIMGIGPYTTAKFAVTGYCDVIRQEMRLFGVSVHVIEPGFFKTTLISPENVDKQLMSMYESCPDDAKREYGHQFFMESELLVVV